jgi:PLP dependent protein
MLGERHGQQPVTPRGALALSICEPAKVLADVLRVAYHGVDDGRRFKKICGNPELMSSPGTRLGNLEIHYPMRVCGIRTTSFRTMSSQSSRQEHIKSSLNSVLSSVKAASSSPVRLVAVSKYIPVEDIRTAYDTGQRHFGENYIQELITKSTELPDDIKWHFIGSLQSNKCKLLVEKVKNLWCVETVDSQKKAGLLEKATATVERNELLKVFIQINTSGEERMSDGMALTAEKGGVELKDVVSLVKYIKEDCPHLHFAGLMTIGSAVASHSANEHCENPDFEV